MGCGVSRSEKNSDEVEVPEHLLATRMAMNGMKVNYVVLWNIFIIDLCAKVINFYSVVCCFVWHIQKKSVTWFNLDGLLRFIKSNWLESVEMSKRFLSNKHKLIVNDW